MKTCTDWFNCSLPEPQTGEYGSTCSAWDVSDFLPTMQHTAAWIRRNAPSGNPGGNFMGSIHPRLKRPVGRRLAYAAARMMKQQQSQLHGAPDDAGAMTGPTIAGCSYSTGGALELKFNVSLLGGEALLLRDFDANATGGWTSNPYNDNATWIRPYARQHTPFEPTYDSLGLMVCTAEFNVAAVTASGASRTGVTQGNATTCACRSWDWVMHNTTNATTGKVTLEDVWYCSSGPSLLWQPTDQDYKARGEQWINGKLHGRQRPFPNPFRAQWAPAPLRPTSPHLLKSHSYGVEAPAGANPNLAVDLSGPHLKGKTIHAVRLAWPLSGGYGGAIADTCCPTRTIQDGHGICIPGSCPLYSAESQLPANPFFAAVGDGRCHCAAPQQCDD
jgi:hypothetical protein